VVRRVFNDSLNHIWRDLFVRLAPEEPFVPAFALPSESEGLVEAILETIYRAGGKGGNPRAMLSAGNLNTAALTLFLSLHLSVQQELPWLVIDDPVQSMDEVHIAQFAALLRTLSKGHGRQVILAVHERSLFDYLALELSPAFSDDKLITIELGQAGNGKTVCNFEPLTWTPTPHSPHSVWQVSHGLMQTLASSQLCARIFAVFEPFEDKHDAIGLQQNIARFHGRPWYRASAC
jgi:exonuclease SbcC